MSVNTLTKEVQRLCVERGFDPGPIDGIPGKDTLTAALRVMRGEKPEPVADPAPVTGVFDPRTEKNLKTLQPGAQRAFRKFLPRAIQIAASMGCEAKVICGLRNRADQEKAKASGASKAGYGYSWHNYGMAIDLGLFKGGNYVDSSNPGLAERVYAAIGAVAPEFGIEWGGSWKSFKDTPHFHVDTGRSTPSAAVRKQLNEGTFAYV